MIMCMLLSATSTHSKWELMLHCLHCPTLNKVFLLLLLLLLLGVRCKPSINGLVQDCSNSIVNALELLQSCTIPSMHLRQVTTKLQWNLKCWLRCNKLFEFGENYCIVIFVVIPLQSSNTKPWIFDVQHYQCSNTKHITSPWSWSKQWVNELHWHVPSIMVSMAAATNALMKISILVWLGIWLPPYLHYIEDILGSQFLSQTGFTSLRKVQSVSVTVYLFFFITIR